MLILEYLDFYDEVQVSMSRSAVLSEQRSPIHFFQCIYTNLNELIYDRDKLNFNCERTEFVKAR